MSAASLSTQNPERRILEHHVVGVAGRHRLAVTIGERRVEPVDNVFGHGGHPRSAGRAGQ